MSWVANINETEFNAALVTALANRPNQPSPFGNGLDAGALKDHFDKAVIVVKKKLDELIDALGEGDLPVDENTTLSGLIASIKSGTFANETLTVQGEGDKPVKLQALLSALISSVAENEASISELLKDAGDGTFASETLMVESVTNGSLVNLRQALVGVRDYVDGACNLLAESYEVLGEEVYGTDPENPADGTIKKRLNDLKIDFTNLASDLPPRKIEPEPYTLAKRDGEGRIKTSWHNDEASFKAAPDDEAVAMEDVRQFIPYDFVLDMDEEHYVLSFTVKNAQGDKLGDVQQVDLPLESVWIKAAYDAATKSIVLTTRDGNKVSVDVTAITGGLVNRDDFDAELAKKVSKASAKAGKNIPWYDPSNGDEGAYMPSAYERGGSIALRSEKGEIRTGKPTHDSHATTKKYVDDGFVPNIKKAYAILGTGGLDADTGYAINRYYNVNPIGVTLGDVVTWGNPAATAFDTSTPSRTIGVADPIKPIQVANRRYVDGKVDQIANDVAVIWDALGGAIEYASIDSTTNPVSVPSNVFPAATIDKIGTGVKSEVENIISSVVLDDSVPGITASYNDGLFTINSTEHVTDVIIFTARFSKKIPVGSTYYFSAEVVSGSYDISGDGDLSVADGIHAIKIGETISGIADWEMSETNTPINIFNAAVKYNNLVLRMSIGTEMEKIVTPVVSVKKGDETIYTVPEAIRALKYTDRPDPNDSLPVYGLAMSDTVYNYLDLEKKKYVVRCYTDFLGELAETNATIDVSAYLTDEDGEITVAAGDEILFADADGNSVGSTVPSTITYILKKGAS